METGELRSIKEIEDAFRKFRTCPKCRSNEGFWIGLKLDHLYTHCKTCGSRHELFEVYPIDEKERAMKRSSYFKR